VTPSWSFVSAPTLGNNMAREQILATVNEFLGLGNPFITSNNPAKTRHMTNMRSQFGRIIGRDGFTTLGLPADTWDVTQLADYKQGDGTSKLIRFKNGLLAASAQLDQYIATTGLWTAINAGTNLTIAQSVNSFIDYTNHNKNFTWAIPTELAVHDWTGSGNAVQRRVAGLGSKFVVSFSGYILMGYCAGGTVQGTTVRYNTALTLAAATDLFLNLNETPGNIKRMGLLGKTCVVYKTDGATILRFVGSNTVTFSQERAPLTVGLLASASLQDVPSLGHIGLFTDGQLYLFDGNTHKPLLNEMNNTLLRLLNKAWAQYSYSTLNPVGSIYSLYFPSGANSFLDKRLEFNYRTGEFTIFDYVEGFSHALASNYLASDDTSPVFSMVASKEKQIYALDTGLTDNGRVNPYEWQTDWLNLGSSTDKYVTKVELTFDPLVRGQIEVSFGKDYGLQFYSPKRMNLAATGTEDMFVIYELPSPTLLRQLNVKIKFFPTILPSGMVLKGLNIIGMPAGGSIRTPNTQTRGIK